MRGATHALIGVTLGFSLGLASQFTLTSAGALALVAGVAALVPDLDHAGSSLSRRLQPFSWLVRLFTHHRGFTHSLAALALVGAAVLHYAPQIAPPLIAGYASHIVVDMLTRSGVLLFWPLSVSIHLLPKGLRITTGKRAEHCFAALVLVALFASLNALLPPSHRLW